jgi:Tfp pilus assembly protein PilV
MTYELLLSIKKEWSTTKIRKGFVLLEVILASSLFIILLTAFTGAYLYGEEASAEAGNRISALTFAESGVEAVRNIRNEDFSNLTSGQHGLLFSNGTWSFSGVSDKSGIFTRTVTISTSTTDRASATTTVTWKQNERRTGSVSLPRIFSNWLDLRYWYFPGLIASTTLANGGDKIQVQGNYAYVIAYSASKLYVVDVTSSTSPVVSGSVNLTGILSNLAVSGNYVYVTSNNNNKELQIVNVTNKSAPTVAGSYNAQGNSTGIGVAVNGTKLYMTRKNSAQDQFVVLNISNPTNPSLLGSLDLGADGYGLVVSDTYAYVSTNANRKEFQIINITNPSTPTLTGSADISQFAQSGVSSVSMYGGHAYVGQGKDLYVVDISTPASPVLKSVTSVADAFNDISNFLGNKGAYIFVATSDVNKEFKVYDVSSSTKPVIYGTSLNLTGDNPLYGISYATATNIVYAVSHDAAKNFFIIAP